MAVNAVNFDEAALAAIRAYLGWHLTPVRTETVTVSVRHVSRDLPLPSARIVNIEQVEVWDDWSDTWQTLDPAEYGWDPIGLLRAKCRPFMRGLSNVRITMTHGYEPGEVPDVLALAETISRRARTNPGGIASQSVNGASVSFQTAGGAPLSVGLLQIEKAALDTYRVGAGRIPG